MQIKHKYLKWEEYMKKFHRRQNMYLADLCKYDSYFPRDEFAHKFPPDICHFKAVAYKN